MRRYSKLLLFFAIFTLMFILVACGDASVTGVKDARINDANELVLVLTDDKEINLGVVVGKDGAVGLKGADGAKGADGLGVKSVSVDANGDLIVTLSDNSTINAGAVKGADGAAGKDGVDGKDGAAGKDGVDGKDGAAGKDGEDGKDGIDGKEGLSSYDLYIAKYPGYTGDADQWIDDLVLGKLVINITYNLDGGIFAEGDVVPAYVMNGGLLVVEAEPMKEENLFVKWFADAELKVEFDFSKPITKDVVLYADYVQMASAVIDYAAVWNNSRQTYYIKVTAGIDLDATNVKEIYTYMAANEFVKPIALTPDTDKVMWFGVAKADLDLTLKEEGVYAYKVVLQDDSEYYFMFNYERAKVTNFPEVLDSVIDYAAVWNATRKEWYVKVTVADGELLDAASVKSIRVLQKAGVLLDEFVELSPDTDKVLWMGVAGVDGMPVENKDGLWLFEVVKQDDSKYLFEVDYDHELVTGLEHLVSLENTELDDLRVLKGEAAVQPADPVKAGFYFAGWYADEDFAEEFDWDTKIVKNSSVYAYWLEIIEVTSPHLAYWNESRATWYIRVAVPGEDLDAASIKAISRIMAAGVIIDPVALTPDTDKVLWLGVAGVEGNVWTDKAGEYQFRVVRKDDSEYVFTITFDDKEVTGLEHIVSFDVEDLANVRVLKGEAALKPADPLKENHDFVAWYSDAELTQAYDWDSLVTANIKLYAKWLHHGAKVNYNMNGGVFVAEKEFTITNYNAGSGTGNYITIGTKEKYASAVGQFWDRLYIKSTSDPKVFEIVDFGVNGAALSESDYDYVIGAHSSAIDKISMNTVIALAKAESIGKFIQLSVIPTTAGTVSVTAKVFADSDFVYATGATLVHYFEDSAPKAITKPHYHFVGWYANPEFTGDAVTEIDASVDGVTINLYPKFTPTVYTITYELNGGTTSDEARATSYTIESGEILLPLDDTMEKAGFDFKGWYDNSAFAGDPVTKITTGSTGNLVFYARWLAPPIDLDVSEADVAALNLKTPDVIVGADLSNLSLYILKGTGIDTAYNTLEVVGFSNIADAMLYLSTNSYENKNVYVFPGTYSEALTIAAKGTTIYGPNYNIHGHDTRSAEALVTGLTNITGKNSVINGLKFSDGGGIKVSADDVTISHIFTMANQISPHTENRKGVIVDGAVMQGLSILNSWIKAPGASQSYTTQYLTFSHANNLTIEGNYIENDATTVSDAFAGMRIYNVIGTLNIINNEFHFATDGYVMYIGQYAQATNSTVNIIDNLFTGNNDKPSATITIAYGRSSTNNIRGNKFIDFGPATFSFANSDASTKTYITYNYYGPGKDYRVGSVGNGTLTLDYNCYDGPIGANDLSGAANEATAFDTLAELEAAYAIAFPK